MELTLTEILKMHPKEQYDLLNSDNDCPFHDADLYEVQCSKAYKLRYNKGIVSLKKGVNTLPWKLALYVLRKFPADRRHSKEFGFPVITEVPPPKEKADPEVDKE